MRYSKILLTVLLAAPAACGGKSSTPTPLVLTPCQVSGVGSPDSVWHQVRGAGFTFCIPPSWQPSGRGKDTTDARRWTGNQGWVTWGVGSPPASSMRRAEITGTVVTEGSAPPPAPYNPPADAAGCGTPSMKPVTVDGVSLLIRDSRCGGKWTTLAWSTAPAMFIQGEVNNPAAAELLKTVMQTIRFN